ncbi:L-serine ammonia-lyase [Fimbriiglobus ruber]|uniref:L-serine dehydratase n=1 Tax=Fimbriiglobus ruber TaxID=1908690 RepID=A0A225EC25_9BACT|nr:L-serine ammonia-lyase [Fimbriiglobus ruber]OWK46889.1 L-serine dehydratase [Fimbriiglobus ruber]
MDAISTFDIFKIGVGPSSSHTLGPWRAAQRFRSALDAIQPARVRIDLYGSLAKTGRGHGTDLAVLMGLIGEDPVTCDTASLHGKVATIRATGRIPLTSNHSVPFDLVFHTDATLPFHPNGLTFTAVLEGGGEHAETYYSVGGGFVVREGETEQALVTKPLPLPFSSAAELLRHCHEQNLSIPDLVRRNERTWRTDEEIRAGLARLWETMCACTYRGCHAEGILPGGLNVVRRAAAMNRHLLVGKTYSDVGSWLDAVRQSGGGFRETLKWVSCFALAVNEENAAFGRVVTAPTNGAAGVIPAVLLYEQCFCRPGTGVEDFLLTAAAVGMLFKQGATISAAMGGCQAEIGVSSAMAAAGLTQSLGGSVATVLMAAEIAMEHHLGMTCDPVGGLVQVPCIERNTMGAIKAITACNLALESDPDRAKVSLDAVIRSMWQTALDMNAKYKETAEGGLAIQISVNVIEC